MRRGLLVYLILYFFDQWIALSVSKKADREHLPFRKIGQASHAYVKLLAEDNSRKTR